MEDLVSRIYDSAIRPSSWPGVLETLCRELDSSVAAAVSIGRDEERLEGTFGVAPGFGDGFLGRWDETPGLSAAFAAARVGSVTTTAGMMPIEVLERSRIYNEWSRPQGVKYAIAGLSWRGSNGASFFGLLRAPRFGEYTDEQAAWLGRLMPHFTRAAEIRQHIGRVELERSALTATLARLAAGVIVLDASGRVVYANPVAEALAREPDGLSVGPNGLGARLSQQTLELRSLVQDAINSSLGRGTRPGGSLALTRAPSRGPLHVTVTPVGRETAELWGDRGPAAVVFVSDPERAVRAIPTELQRMFGLTPSQARLTMFLVEGANLREAAERLGIRVSTARNHLKEVLSRSGVRRQSELIALVLRSLPPLR